MATSEMMRTELLTLEYNLFSHLLLSNPVLHAYVSYIYKDATEALNFNGTCFYIHVRNKNQTIDRNVCVYLHVCPI